MRTHIITIIILVAFLNCLFGCATTRTVKLLKEEVGAMSQTKIVGVTKISSDVIRFDNWGGRFDTKAKVVEGRTPEGMSAEIDFGDIRYVQVEKTEDNRTTTIEYQVESYKGEVTSKEKITKVILSAGCFVNFNKKGGYFDLKTNSILGTTQDGDPLEIRLDDVLCVEVEINDPLSSLAITSFYFGTVANLLISILVAATWD